MTGKELYGPVGAKEPILFNGKLGWIRVFCKQCNIDYDIREVDNETTHPTAAHVVVGRPNRANGACFDGRRTRRDVDRLKNHDFQAGEGWQDSVVPHRHLCTV